MSINSPIGHLEARPLEFEQARLLEAASPMPILVADVEADGFSVLAVSPLLRRFITGARHPAGPTPAEVIPSAGFGVLGHLMEATREDTGRQHTMELPIGDEPRWFEVVTTPVSGEGGCVQIILVATDRTSDRDLEQRQRRSTHRLEAMVDHAPGLILLLDSTGRIIFASPAVDRLLGIDATDIAGRPIFELLHPDTLARSASVFNQLLSSPGAPVHVPDFRLNHADGGQLWCEATGTNLLHDDDVAAIVLNAYDVTDRRMAEERLDLLATTDSLTGLANRRRLLQRLDTSFDAASRTARPVGLALVDLDDFKLVNDALGHDVGDQVLRLLANRLESAMSGRGFVARIGGDEFALALEVVETDRDLTRVSEAVHELLRSPVKVGEHEVYLRASVGTTTGSPESADPGSLLRSADLALYRAKRNGRNQTVAFTAELQIQAEDRLVTITELQKAIRQGRLRLAYQPVVDVEGSLVGAEALLRWEHDGELILPADFLDLAEDTGLILPMGAWVLDQACRDLTSLRSALPDLGWISVNLSSRQLLDERLPFVVASTLRNHDLGPGSIAVEVNEHALTDLPGIDRILNELEDVQVMLSLGDLVTDQSGLYQLDQLPVTTIKIDRGLVRGLDVDPDGDVRSLAFGVLQLADELGVGVIAEGVETQREAQVLRELGCPYLQGFHISEPLDLASFILWNRQH